jgi:hypothetical protein
MLCPLNIEGTRALNLSAWPSFALLPHDNGFTMNPAPTRTSFHGPTVHQLHCQMQFAEFYPFSKPAGAVRLTIIWNGWQASAASKLIFSAKTYLNRIEPSFIATDSSCFCQRNTT